MYITISPETKEKARIYQMIRKIIQIDERRCNGCGLCASACHEGAIGMVNGKARLLRDDYCDGLGDCLPACPVNAISFVEREAAAYDAEAVEKNKKEKLQNNKPPVHACPGSMFKTLEQPESADTPCHSEPPASPRSMLGQWPAQIRLIPTVAPCFENASLLIAADCTAYAYARFHEDFMRGKVTLIGCPKLDDTDYSEKLTAIIKENSIRNVTIARMEVPCCGGLENAVKKALQNSGKFIPWQVVTISIDGKIL